MKRALLFDLDETLMVEEPAAVAAFTATAQFAQALSTSSCVTFCTAMTPSGNG